MAHRGAGRGSGHGIHRPILETSMGCAGTVLEADLSEAGRCRPHVGNTSSGASTVESWAAGAQERLSRRPAFGETVGVARADLKLRARCRTAPLADRDAHKVPAEAQQSTAAESTGGAAGRGAYQIIQFGFGSIGRQCTSYAEGASRRRNRPRGSSYLGRSALARHIGAA